MPDVLPSTATTTTVTTYQCPKCSRSGLSAARFAVHPNGLPRFNTCRRCEIKAKIRGKLRNRRPQHRYYADTAIRVFDWVADRPVKGITRDYIHTLHGRDVGEFWRSLDDIAASTRRLDDAIDDLIELHMIADDNGTLVVSNENPHLL